MTRHHLAERYLERLRAALTRVPADRRDEIVEEVAEHLDAAIAGEAGKGAVTDATVQTILDRVGDVADIAREAGETADQPPVPREHTVERITIALLLFGGFAGGVGWLIGVALLWLSPVWRLSDKVLGTLLVPGGLVAAVPALLITFAMGGPGVDPISLMAPLLVAGPLYTAVRLNSRLREAALP